MGAIAATALLAGGAVASYIIIDNANKTGIHITPNVVNTETGSVTLSWGDNTGFTDIQGLRAGTPVTKSVVIKAETRDAEDNVDNDAVYEGSLDVELRDLSGKAAEAKKLIDYLTVSVKAYAYTNSAFAGEKTEIASLSKASSLTSSNLVYADKNGKQVDFVVSLDASASPVMNQIMNDSVYLSVDWNRSAADANATKRVYIPEPTGWNAMYVYSWSDDGSQNANWPGVQLAKDPENGLYVADLLAHDYFIFTEAADATDHRYPADGQGGMAKASINYNTAACIYFDWTQHVFTDVAPVTYSAPYYLVGDATAWDFLNANAFEEVTENVPDNADHQWKMTVTAEADAEYKIRTGSTAEHEQWFGIGNVEDACKDENTGLVYGTDNFAFKAAGTYDIYLKQLKESAGGGYSIYIANHA